MRNAKLVEDAACLCSAMANLWVNRGECGLITEEIQSSIGLGRYRSVYVLASQACDAARWMARHGEFDRSTYIERWALAASMLMNGEIQ